MEKYKGYKDKEKRKASNRIFQARYREKMKSLGLMRPHDKNVSIKVRKKAMEYLGGCFCVNCGCYILDILEINHINLGGRQEHLQKGLKLYRDIYLGRVPKENYNVLCRVCNAIHYVETKFNIQGFNLTWKMPLSKTKVTSSSLVESSI